MPSSRSPSSKFAAAVLPAIPATADRTAAASGSSCMAAGCDELEQQYQSILFVCSLTDWPWIREAYVEQPRAIGANGGGRRHALLHRPEPQTLVFLLGELPFITGLYERRGPNSTTMRTCRSTA